MRRLIGLLTAAVILASCTSGGADVSRLVGPRFDPSRLTFAAALTPFSACDAVLAYFKAEALERVGPYGLEGIGFFPVWREMPVFADDATSAPGEGGAGVGHSTSNVQVSGVDEPDLVKTDGRRIISVVDGILRYTDLSEDTPRLLGSLGLDEGWGHRLLVSDDRAFVFSIAHAWAFPMGDAIDRIMPAGRPQTQVVEVDLSNPSALRVERTLTIDGGYVSARQIDGTVRLVVSSYPDDLGFVYPSSEAGEAFALETNRRVIQESTIEQWLPSFTLMDASGNTIGSGLAVPCERMHRPAEFSGFSTLSVTTLDIERGLSGGTGTGVIASGETVYASATSLYVATSVWLPSEVWARPDAGEIADRYATSIHRFGIDGDGLAVYRASGSVEGHLLDQFSMDEHEGLLRVAVTDGPPWGFSDRSESRVLVLEERNGSLEVIGSVGDMGRGERIFSVRFMGDVGYVVTFRQVDPFYVVDLRDPTAPRVTGELKIEGYSSYLHPIGQDLVLGVGQDADDRGWTLGVKATVFDVSDPTAPREAATWRSVDSYSDVEWDHLAFLAWAPADIVVIPVQSWSRGMTGAVVLSTVDGLEEIAWIEHERREAPVPDDGCVVVDEPAMGRDVIVMVCESDIAPAPGCETIHAEDWAWWEEAIEIEVDGDDIVQVCWPEPWPYQPQILRSLVIGDALWTLSSGGLQANALDGFAQIASVPFSR